MKITIVQGDEWWGIYKDGKLVAEENPNNLDARTVLSSLGLEFETKYPDEDWLYQYGRLPEDERKVKWQPCD